MDFVDRVLSLQGDSPIKKFSLKCKTGVDPDRVNLWICNVLQRGVSDLELCLDFPTDYDFYHMPDGMFESKTLINVKFRREFGVDWWGRGPRQMLPREWYGDPKSISFDTPNLVYLDYSDYVAADYPKVNLTNLVEAQLNLLATKDQISLIRVPNGEDNIVIQRFRNVSKLMSGMRNVRKLSLTSHTLEVLSVSCDSMPVFNNLKFLYIESHKERGWQAMPVLLRNCPHLETLVLQGLLHDKTDKCGDACDCIIRQDKGLSLASCPVKMLKIKGFLGTRKEMAMIKHFLKHFPGLKKIDIFVEEDELTQLRVPAVRELILQMIDDYNCDVQLW